MSTPAEYCINATKGLIKTTVNNPRKPSSHIKRVRCPPDMPCHSALIRAQNDDFDCAEERVEEAGGEGVELI
jgi:hypothetical protein